MHRQAFLTGLFFFFLALQAVVMQPPAFADDAASEAADPPQAQQSQTAVEEERARESSNALKAYLAPDNFPQGWNDCMEMRAKIAYVRGLSWYARLPLEPYRLVKKWQYVRCMKSMIPETEDFMRGRYPVPYEPKAQQPLPQAPQQSAQTETPERPEF